MKTLCQQGFSSPSLLRVGDNKIVPIIRPNDDIAVINGKIICIYVYKGEWK